MHISKYLAAIFLVFIAYLTITYFSINKGAMSEGYKLLLGAISVLNILYLSLTIFNPEKNFYRVVGLLMLMGGILKALFERSIPNTHLNDFIFTIWRFNDDWPYIIKVIWHTSLDWLVLCIILGIKNSYRLFQ